jgi:hypothetical protein
MNNEPTTALAAKPELDRLQESLEITVSTLERLLHQFSVRNDKLFGDRPSVAQDKCGDEGGIPMFPKLNNLTVRINDLIGMIENEDNRQNHIIE